jgi:UDP-N-acetylglucosamine 1-carboxyvinyltransferase
MDMLLVEGGAKLSGKVEVSSSKNASLPILASSLLFPFPVHFQSLPLLSDIKFFNKILESLGAKINDQDHEVTQIDCSDLNSTHADYEFVRKMRASILVLGPLLSRFHEAEVSLPGGCAIGARPVDIHLEGLKKLGAEIELSQGYVKAKAPGGLKGTRVYLSFPSVGATENLMMAAVYAEGVTTIANAAKEPEIFDLARFLRKMGVEVTGAGTEEIVIHGTKPENLKADSSPFRVLGDRIEAATFIMAGLMTKSQIEVSGVSPVYIKSVLDVLEQMGAEFTLYEDSVLVHACEELKPARAETAPYPGFPTDVQAQLMALMGTVPGGTSLIKELIFENRFMHVPELSRMGMDIELEGHTAFVKGVRKLSSAPVMCTDLRASAALILAALVAEGESQVRRIYHLDRGYQNIEKKLSDLGAKIKRVKE